MLALTLKHPWPFAICYLGKQVENRNWDESTADLMHLPEALGEAVAIHGGTAPQRPKGGKHWSALAASNPWRQHCEDLQAVHRILGGELPDAAAQYLARTVTGPLIPEAFILPGVVAVGVLQSVTRASRDRWAGQGQLHLLLADVVVLPERVACPGSRGFWDLPPVVEAEVRRQVEQVQAGRPARWGHLEGAAWLG